MVTALSCCAVCVTVLEDETRADPNSNLNLQCSSTAVFFDVFKAVNCVSLNYMTPKILALKSSFSISVQKEVN